MLTLDKISHNYALLVLMSIFLWHLHAIRSTNNPYLGHTGPLSIQKNIRTVQYHGPRCRILRLYSYMLQNSVVFFAIYISYFIDIVTTYYSWYFHNFLQPKTIVPHPAPGLLSKSKREGRHYRF